MAEVQTVQWVDVEVSPLDSARSFFQNRVILDAEHEALPNPFRDALRIAADRVDDLSCQANGCEQAVGFLLAGDRDEAMEWRWMALVQRTDGSVIATCEDCSPGTLYDPVLTDAPILSVG